MAGKPSNELEGRRDLFSAWAERVALLILMGLFVEIGAVFILHKPWLESILSVGATSLIAIGVFGELVLERIARNAGDKFVADANARAAEAQARSAEAEVRLGELRKDVGPRQLDVDAFRSELEGQPKAPVEVMFDEHAADASFLSQRIRLALSFEGWNELVSPSRPIPPPPPPWTITGPKNLSFGLGAWGLAVVSRAQDKHLVESRNALARALSKGLPGQKIANSYNEFVPQGKIRILVGPKP